MSIRLPQLRRAQVALDNVVAGLHQPLPLAVAGHQAQLVWTAQPTTFAVAAALDVVVHGMPARVLVDADPLDGLLDLPVAADDLARLPGGFQAVLLAGVFADLVSRLSKLGLVVEPRALVRSAGQRRPALADARAAFTSDLVRLAWQLFDGDDRLWVRGEVLLAAELADRVMALARQSAAEATTAAVDDWTVLGGITLGRTDLSLAELASIDPGDVIVVRRHNWSEQQAEIRIADRFCYAVEVGEQALTVLQSKEIRRVNDDEDGGAPSGSAGAGSPPAAAVPELDDMPVTLAFDIGEVEVALGELRQIGKGYAFNLRKPLDGAVTMRVNGRMVGRGELVEIEGSLGVRVVELFAKGHG